MKCKSFVRLISIGMVVGLGLCGMTSTEVNATELAYNQEQDVETITEVHEITKFQLIEDYANYNDVSYEEAEETLFKTSNKLRSTSDNDSNYVVLSVRETHRQITDYAEDGKVYFYCETTEGGWFRAIKKILYAGYNNPSYGYAGTLQYVLTDPNIIHYTLNGKLYNYQSTTYSGGVSIGVGEFASINMGVSSTSDFVKNVWVDKDVRF